MIINLKIIAHSTTINFYKDKCFGIHMVFLLTGKVPDLRDPKTKELVQNLQKEREDYRLNNPDSTKFVDPEFLKILGKKEHRSNNRFEINTQKNEFGLSNNIGNQCLTMLKDYASKVTTLEKSFLVILKNELPGAPAHVFSIGFSKNNSVTTYYFNELFDTKALFEKKEFNSPANFIKELNDVYLLKKTTLGKSYNEGDFLLLTPISTK
jgi:hypothetical protein